MAWDDNEVFEQRRLRHVTSIHIRNLEIPSLASTSTTSTTLYRPRPRRSVSTASSSSVATIRRAPSVKGTPTRSRGRASSIASSHKFALGYPDLDEQFQSDLADLLRQVEEKLCYTFITLSSVGDGRELYRSSPSSDAGVHFDWGRIPGSSSDAAGLPLFLLQGEGAVADDVNLTIWYKKRWSSEKGKAREEHDGMEYIIEQGKEKEEGWSVGLECNVVFGEMQYMTNDLANLDVTTKRNTILFGLANSFAMDQSEAKGEKIPVDGAKDVLAINDGRKAMSNDRHSRIRYYHVKKASEYEHEKEKAKASAYSAMGKNDDIAMLKNGISVRGYDVEDILRLLQLQKELCSAVRAVSLSASRSGALLQDDTRIVPISFLCAEKKERIAVLKKERDRIQEGTKASRRSIQERIEIMNRRKARLEIARRAMAKEKIQYKSMREKLIQLERQCESLRSKKYARRVTLLQQLEFIYPIELVDGAKLLFSIVNVPLANRVVEDEVAIKQGEEDDIVSSALGLIGQVIVLLSVYLDTPIHYSIITAGSRSIIQDSISVMTGPRAFSLYSKGVESYRFEYAIFLLNKDIEQLMNHFSITVLDIRNTLPNLKNLMVTMSASSLPQSRLSRRNLIGNETISLKADVKRPSTPVQFNQPFQREPTLNGEKQSQRAAPTWGMSLLGWGSVKGQETHSAHVTNGTSTTQLPTVRTLGGTRN